MIARRQRKIILLAVKRSNGLISSRRSLQVAQEDIAVKDTIHSDQGYEGVHDGGADWRNSYSLLSVFSFSAR